MKTHNWLRDMVEEFSYKTYLENNPALVELIKTALNAGEPASKIKKFVRITAGSNHQLTSNLISTKLAYPPPVKSHTSSIFLNLSQAG